MGLKAIAANAARIAFAVAGDALETLAYNAKGAATYNTSTGTVTQTSTATNIPVLVETMTAKELADWGVTIQSDMTGVFKLTAKAASFSSAPKTGDTFTRNGKTLHIIGVRPGDPTTAIYEIAASEAG